MSRFRLAGVLGLLVSIAFLGLTHGVHAGSPAPAATKGIAHIFFSGGCADCWPYLEETLLPALSTIDLAETAEVHDFTRPGGRAQLLEMSDQAGLPREMADSLYAFIPQGESKLVSMGHVPQSLLETALNLAERPAGLVIWQPQMHGEPVEYRL